MARPRKYESPEQMQKAIDAYFDLCKAEERGATMCGLALALDFNSRQSLLNYEGYGEGFLDILKKAHLRVEAGYEANLHKPKPTGSIFALKNMGWKDNQEHTVKLEESKPLTLEEMEERIQAMKNAGDGLVTE